MKRSKPVVSVLLAKVAVSDVFAMACAAAGLYGLSILHPAAPWIGASALLGFISVEIGKREAAKGREE